jgi:hypothetical protein
MLGNLLSATGALGALVQHLFSRPAHSSKTGVRQMGKGNNRQKNDKKNKKPKKDAKKQPSKDAGKN